MSLYSHTVLAVHANVWLCGDREAVQSDFVARHPAFRHHRMIDFEPGLTFQEWLHRLDDLGMERVWLHRPARSAQRALPEHVAIAFAGGTKIGLLCTGSAPTELWTSRLQRIPVDPQTEAGEHPPKAGGNRSTWQRAFTRHTASEAVPQIIELEEATDALATALTQIKAFASAQHLERWRLTFAEAIARLEGRDERGIDRHRDAFPADALSPDAIRLLRAAERAWVFGGMGSWNDVGFPDKERWQRHEAVTAALYDGITAAHLAVTNGGEPAARS